MYRVAQKVSHYQMINKIVLNRIDRIEVSQ